MASNRITEADVMVMLSERIEGEQRRADAADARAEAAERDRDAILDILATARATGASASAIFTAVDGHIAVATGVSLSRSTTPRGSKTVEGT